MNREEKKRFLMMAVPCLRRREPPFPILREIENKKPIPSSYELNSMKEGLKTGDIEENILEKFFPSAYRGVNDHGFYKYFYQIHNQNLMNMKSLEGKV
jgi:hypothetical protein